jgi:hypothetical protein
VLHRHSPRDTKKRAGRPRSDKATVSLCLIVIFLPTAEDRTIAVLRAFAVLIIPYRPSQREEVSMN